MTANAFIYNVTVDDFDPLVGYSNYAEWYTPDPSINPTWYNASRDVTGSPWHEATYHTTTTPNARFNFNFTGSSIYIYGAAGPTAGNTNYTVLIDGTSSQPFNQTYTATNSSNNERILLYGTDGLRYARHTVEVVNRGSGLTFDVIAYGSVVGAQGATVRNSTIEDAGGQVRFTGNWTTQQGPNFSNGTSTYTRGANNGMAFNFEGSAVYLYGDQVNDHGFYEIYLDQGDTPWNNGATPNATLNDRSGCGGGWAKACEKLKGLKYQAGGLAQGQHTLAMRNLGVGSYPGDPTFFDFDYVFVTVPSAYANVQTQAGSCPFVNCNSTSGTGTSPSPSLSGTATSPSGAASSRAAAVPAVSPGGMGSMMGWGLAAAWVLRKFLA